MVRGDAVHDHRILAVLRGHLHAELHVRPLVLVREHLADVVQQRAAPRHGRIEPELLGHHPGQPRHFLGVDEDVLPVARPVMHAPDELHELGVQPMDAGLVRRLLAHLLNGVLHLAAALGDDLLDAPRMDAPVGDELGERDTRRLAADRIEAGDDHRIGRIVDDDVHTGRQLERADVPSLASDDAPLHLVVGERDRRHRDLRRVLGGDPLHGEGDDLLRLALGGAAGGLADLAQPVRRLGLRLLLEPVDQLGLRLGGGHPGELLEPASLLAEHALELERALVHRLFLAAELAPATADLLVALLQDVELAVEVALPLLHAPLGALELLAPLGGFGLPLLAQLDRLFLPGDHGRLAQRVRLSPRVVDDAVRRLFGGGLRIRVRLTLRAPPG